MIESIFSIFMGVAFLAISLRSLISVPVASLRMNWRGTNIRTGAISNLGFGIFFLNGSILTLFIKEPIDSFLTVFVFVIVPVALASWLCFHGYKCDTNRDGASPKT